MWRLNISLSFLLFSLITMSGCGTPDYAKLRKLPPHFPPVGLIADSQITTTNGSNWWLMRSRFADFFVGVSIRPPALEQLAPEMLKHMLGKTIAQSEIVLYLGDAANSGCLDELSVVFSTLDDFRRKTGKPIFFVIGNHDYLGAGNVSEPTVRETLCGPNNPPLSKYQLCEMAHNFNAENRGLAGVLSYEDNFEELKARHNANPAPEREMHHKLYYLAGRVIFQRSPDAQPVEFLLADSSDYHGQLTEVELGKRRLQFYGVRAGISFQGTSDTQVSYFERFPATNSVRFVASHYPSKAIELPGSKYIRRNYVGRAGDLLSENSANYWVFAHTHAAQPTEYAIAFTRGESWKPHALAFNVGSTTDHEPNALVLFSEDGLQKSTITSDASQSSVALLDTMDHLLPGTLPVFGKNKGKIIYGLTDHYKKKTWQGQDTLNARHNLNLWVTEKTKGMSPDQVMDVIAAIMDDAARAENRSSRFSVFRGWRRGSAVNGLTAAEALSVKKLDSVSK